MHLEAHIVVNRSPADVWTFFKDPLNLSKWGRSVARVVSTCVIPVGGNYTFDTFAPSPNGDGFRSLYRVAEFQPGKFARIDLTSSKWFNEARWRMAVEPSHGGTRVTCSVTLTVRWKHFYQWPIL